MLESREMPLEIAAVEELETRIGYEFADRSLVRSALTHRSLAHERGDRDHYERLEFLGDSVLGLISAEWLFLQHPTVPEGELARLKSHLVSAPVLASYARSLGLGDLLLLGLGEDQSGGREKASLLADCLEAVFGAVYLDRGLEAAGRVIRTFLETAVEQGAEVAERDAKTRLQELLQSRGWALPAYRLVETFGPDHDKLFRVECWIEGEMAGSGDGQSKKLAEQAAAASALGEEE